MKKITVAITVDDKMGIAFNNRRQSRDVKVTEDIIATALKEGAELWALPFSEKLLAQFSEFKISADAFRLANDGDYVFVEEPPIKGIIKNVNKMVVYKWNRLYPSDKKLDTPPDIHGFKLGEVTEFVGNSHDLITKEVWVK